MSAKQILIGTVAGVVAGAVAGILLAPQSGEETRQQISDKTDEVKRKVRNWTSSSIEELEDLKNVFAKEVVGLKDDVRERVLKLINEGKESYENMNA